MTATAKSDAKPGKRKTTSESSNALKVTAEVGVDRSAMLAKVTLRPSVRAAICIQGFAKPACGEVDLTALADELSAQVAAVTKGDLQRAEAMLIAQAHTLESLFYELARRAGLNMGEHLQAAESYMRLALRAQGQCRATLETLATIKNPVPVAFVRQANIAHGPQQVNNGPPQDSASRARETENQPNELLGVSDGKRLDFGAPAAAGKTDSSLETVGEIDRPAHAGR